ncbi:MAG TPA: glutaredoxin family protein [Cellvibrionaceae bacterium]
MVLLTTAGCHLCEDARALLDEASDAVTFTLTEVDIACDDALIERYALRIPVVKLADRELDWPFDREDLKRLLDAC